MSSEHGIYLREVLAPKLRALGVALLLGIMGGALFQWLHMPLPWMLGAVCGTMAGALGGLRMAVPATFRNGMLIVLGVLIGSGFTPDILTHIHRWTISIAGVVIYTLALSLLAYVFFRKVVRYSALDSFFSGLPGGLAAVIFLGQEAGADIRKLSIIHSLRVTLVCFSVPLWVQWSEGVRAVAGGVGSAAGLGTQDALLLVGSGLGGFLLGKVLRIPVPFLLGPMFFSAAVHLGGLTVAKPPVELVRAAQVVVGAAIGCRFVGVPLRNVARMLVVGGGATLGMLLFGLGAAWVLHKVSGLPLAAMVIALAPGGLPEMTLIALALEVDVALVVTHHLVRVLMINFLAPLAYKWLFPAKQPGQDLTGGNG